MVVQKLDNVPVPGLDEVGVPNGVVRQLAGSSAHVPVQGGVGCVPVRSTHLTIRSLTRLIGFGHFL